MLNSLSFHLVLIWLAILSVAASADEWPQWRGPNRDGVWAETGLVEKFAGDKLKLRWRVPVANGYSGPTIADGRVYVTDRLVEPKQVERVLTDAQQKRFQPKPVKKIKPFAPTVQKMKRIVPKNLIPKLAGKH